MNIDKCPQALAASEHFGNELCAGVDIVRNGVETVAMHVYPKGANSIYDSRYSYSKKTYDEDIAFVKANPEADPELVLHEYEYELVNQ